MCQQNKFSKLIDTLATPSVYSYFKKKNTVSYEYFEVDESHIDVKYVKHNLENNAQIVRRLRKNNKIQNVLTGDKWEEYLFNYTFDELVYALETDDVDFKRFKYSSQLELLSRNSTINNFITSSGWYHIVIVWDASESSAVNRVKIYLNNIATSCGNASNPSSFNS